MSSTATQPAPDPNKLRLLWALQEKARRLELHKERTRLEDSLSEFFKSAWQVLEPGRPLTWSWHYDLLCEYLWLIREGEFQIKYPGCSGLIINVPPRTGKSKLATVCYPVWSWTKVPERRFLTASYSAELSTEHSVLRRDLIRSAWFQALWGKNWGIRYDQREKNHFKNTATGEMIATSVGGSMTGRGGDALILDDPLSADQSLSDAERSTANQWVDNTVRSRLNDPASGVIVLIMQRLHELDTTGYVMEQEPGRWVHINIPLEAEDKQEIVFPVSGRKLVRQAGEILQPDRFPKATVEKLKVRRLTWAGQYQQRPAPLEGNMIQRKDVRYYGGIDSVTGKADALLPDKFDQILVSADCAFKDLDTSDFVALGAIGIKGPDRFVLEIVNKHLDLDATENGILRLRTNHKAHLVLVEDKANGSAVIKHLKRKIPAVKEIEPEGGKVARMFAMCPEWQSGNWYVDRNAAWTELLLLQLLTFPNAAHDDMVDSLTQASAYIQAHGHKMGLLRFGQEQQAEKDKQEAQPVNGKANGQEMIMQQDQPASKVDGVDNLGKVDTPDNAKRCQFCDSTFLQRAGSVYRCGKCFRVQTGGQGPMPKGPSRYDLLK